MRCACSTVDFDKLNPRHAKQSWKRLGKVADLFFDPQCPLCSAIKKVSRVGTNHQNRDDRQLCVGAIHTSSIYGHPYTLQSALPSSRKEETRETTSYVAYAVTKSEDIERHLNWHRVNFAREDGWICKVEDKENSDTFHARILKPYLNIGLVQAWLNFCEKNHSSTCGKAAHSNVAHFYLIECHSRTVVRVERPTRYIALSYVWGDLECGSIVVSGDSARALPPKSASTIEDAIALTVALGVNYLWVDQFCINQTNLQEKHQQIRHMDSVYKNAWFTIVAAEGHNADCGLPGISRRLRPISALAKINGQHFTSVPRMASLVICESIWNCRGWTFQESVMSSRLLVLTNDEAYFECHSMNCSEAIHTPLTAIHTKSLKRFISWHRDGIFPSITKGRYPWDDVQRYIEDFRERSLSYPSDSLNAIQGVLDSLERLYPSLLHIWGLPIVPDVTLEALQPDSKRRTVRTSSRVEQLLTSLCWTTSERATRVTDLPSWSWVGWLEMLAKASPYNGYLLNSFGVKAYFQDPNTPLSLIPLDHYCSMHKDQRKRIDSTGTLLLEGTMLNVKFMPYNMRQIGSAYGNSNGIVLLGANYDLFVDNRVFFTAPAEEVDDALADNKHQGIILGERLHTYFSSSGTAEYKRVNDSHSPSLMLLLVRKVQKGWERVGLAIFDNVMASYGPKTFMNVNGKSIVSQLYTRNAICDVPQWRQTICLI